MRLLVLTILASSFELGCGHAYMYWPKSREAQRVQGDKNEAGETWWGYPAAWGMVAHTMNENRGNHPYHPGKVKSQWGIGDGHGENQPFQHPNDFSAWLCNKLAKKPPVATYKEGGDIQIVIIQNAEHGGHHDFRVCPKPWDSLGTEEEKGKCLDMFLIGCDKPSDCGTGKICKCGHQCTPAKECGCYKDGCKSPVTNPHNDYNDPFYKHGKPLKGSMVHGANVFNLKLPKGLSCKECTLQWVWHTTRNGEQFANCADIVIEPDPSNAPSPPANQRRRRRDGGGKKDPTPAPAPTTRRRRRGSPEAPTTRRRSPRRRSPPGKTRRRSSKGRRRSSRRRSSRRRRGGSSRRRSSRRRSTKTNAAAAASASKPDIEYESLGCFPMSEGDTDEIGELEDQTCIAAGKSRESPCRSGLPFYRLRVTTEPVEKCFEFCSSKGLDLFGLHDSECRCGASQSNPVWGHSWSSASDGLALDFSSATGKLSDTDQCNGWSVYRYIGWMSIAPEEVLKKRTEDDAAYIGAIIKSWTVSS